MRRAVEKSLKRQRPFPMREIRGIMARIISLCMGIGNDWFVPGGCWEGRSVTEIIVAAIALIGTAVGSLGGILAANRLTNYRIEQLEKKVDKHNSVIERITVVEVKLSEQQDDLAQLRKELKL